MSSTTTRNPVVLEPASQQFVEATAKPPFLYELTPTDARAVLDGVQAAPIDKLPVDDRWITVPAAVGDVRVRIVRPPDASGTLPVILYMHGGGWVLGLPGRDRAALRHGAVDRPRGRCRAARRGPHGRRRRLGRWLHDGGPGADGRRAR
jgi:acetyl esterase